MTFITPIASAAAAPRLSIASAAAAPRLSIDPRRSSSRSTRRGLRWPFALALFVGACADAPADGIEDGAAAADLGEGRDQAAGDLACASSCGGACVDLQSDPANCGRCGVTCARGEACLMGSCQSAMTPGTRCAMTPPAGARQPPALPRYSGGSCPTLVAGMNGLKSGAANRVGKIFVDYLRNGHGATTATVEFRRTAELCSDDNECLVEELLALKIGHQSREGGVEFLDEQVLVVDAFIVHVPAGAVHEVEIVGNFDEADTCLHQTTGHQA